MRIQNYAYEKIRHSFDDNKIHLITGPRGVGKRMLVQALIDHVIHDLQVREHRIFRYNLDDILVQLRISEDYERFKAQIEGIIGEQIADLTEPIYFFVEQVQNLPQFFENIHRLHKLNPAKTRMVFSSSIKLANNKAFQESLLADTNIYQLYPVSLREIISSRVNLFKYDSILDAVAQNRLDLERLREVHKKIEPFKKEIKKLIQDYSLYGGGPGVFLTTNPKERLRIAQERMREYFNFDLRLVYQIADLRKFHRIIQILSENNGDLLNLLQLCDRYGINRNTMRKYTGIMNDTFLIEFLPPFLKKQVNKPVMKTPKLYFLNNGVVNYLNRSMGVKPLFDAGHWKANMDTMLYVNLKSLTNRLGPDYSVQFLRDYQEHQLDFLVQGPDSLVPIAIMQDHDDRRQKIKTFRYYLRYCNLISDGAIFGDFDKIDVIDMRSSKLYLLPIWMLW